MPDFIFPRTGKQPLACQGELLASVNSHGTKGYLRTHWHDLQLVRSTSGKYVLAIGYRNTYDQPPHDYAVALDSLQAVPPALEEFDPIEHVGGYPRGAQFEGKQQRLLADVQKGYYDACGRLLAEAGIAERV